MDKPEGYSDDNLRIVLHSLLLVSTRHTTISRELDEQLIDRWFKGISHYQLSIMKIRLMQYQTSLAFYVRRGRRGVVAHRYALFESAIAAWERWE